MTSIDLSNLTLGESLCLINVKTLNHRDIPILCKKTTTLQEVKDTFYDNYSLKDIGVKTVLVLTNQKIPIDDIINMTIEDIGLSREINMHVSTLQDTIQDTLPKQDDQTFTQSFDEHINDEDKMLVFIKMLNGKTITSKITENTTVYQLKQLLYFNPYCGRRPTEQRLIFAGIQMCDNDKLKKYGIQDESTIQLVLSLRGGMYNETSGRAGNYQPLKPKLLIIGNIDISLI